MGHPALDFPVYGLRDSPPGPRWIDAVVGRLGHPVDGLWLEHGSTPRDAARPWVRVGTFRRDRFPGAEVDADQRVAFDAVFAVVDATMPHPMDRSEDHGARLLDSASARAASPTAWQQVSWVLGHQSVPASVLHWAGAWVAFTTALPGVDIVVIGFGVEPAGLTLTEVRDAEAYHFDPDQPITFPDTVERSRAAAGVRYGASTADGWWPEHPDHTTATA